MKSGRTQRMPERLFYALWPPAGIGGRLARLAGWCQHRSGGVAVSPEGVHLTVLFLGEVSPQQASLALRAGSGVPMPAFDLVLDRVEYWPGANGQGVLVAVPREGCEPLLDLRRRLRLAAGLRRRGSMGRDAPHVTLVRRVMQLAELPMEPVVWPVREYALMRSVPRNGAQVAGRRYEALEVWSCEP